MPLSRVDETELLIPLYEGGYEAPRWQTLLARLRRRTRADFAGLRLFGEGGDNRLDDDLFAGLDLRTALREISGPGQPAGTARPGRAYSGTELSSGVSPAALAIPHLRIVRTHRVEGLSATLLVAREAADFGASDATLLSELAVHLDAALLGLARLQEQRRRGGFAMDALGATRVGWIGFDADSRVIDCDPLCRQALLEAGARPVRVGERLQLASADGARALWQACATIAAGVDVMPQLVRLSGEPVLNMLLRPAVTSDARSAPATALGVICSPVHPGPDSARLLAAALDVTGSEARLALALADGQSIVEAGAALGFTHETARNYSKRLYAKTGARGQAELVALVLSSVAMLA